MTKKLKHTTNYLENGRVSALMTQICSKLFGFVAFRCRDLPKLAGSPQYARECIIIRVWMRAEGVVNIGPCLSVDFGKLLNV